MCTLIWGGFHNNVTAQQLQDTLASWIVLSHHLVLASLSRIWALVCCVIWLFYLRLTSYRGLEITINSSSRSPDQDVHGSGPEEITGVLREFRCGTTFLYLPRILLKDLCVLGWRKRSRKENLFHQLQNNFFSLIALCLFLIVNCFDCFCQKAVFKGNKYF